MNVKYPISRPFASTKQKMVPAFLAERLGCLLPIEPFGLGVQRWETFGKRHDGEPTTVRNDILQSRCDGINREFDKAVANVPLRGG